MISLSSSSVRSTCSCSPFWSSNERMQVRNVATKTTGQVLDTVLGARHHMHWTADMQITELDAQAIQSHEDPYKLKTKVYYSKPFNPQIVIQIIPRKSNPIVLQMGILVPMQLGTNENQPWDCPGSLSEHANSKCLLILNEHSWESALQLHHWPNKIGLAKP